MLLLGTFLGEVYPVSSSSVGVGLGFKLLSVRLFLGTSVFYTSLEVGSLNDLEGFFNS